jgi:rubrerythrin
METRELYHRALFDALTLLLFGLPLLLLVPSLGCRKQAEEKKESKPEVTIENLRTAYEKSIKHENMYALFAARATKDRLPNVANLYKAAARSEAIHAKLHSDLLRKRGVEPTVVPPESVVVGTTLQTLKFSISSEEIEFGRMYPNLIHSAELEKFAEAVSQFQMAREADLRHAELMKEALDRGGRIEKVPYFVCTGCGYILTSEKTEECPVCHSTRDKFEKI